MSDLDTLVQHVDYRRLAIQTGRITGTLRVSQLPRVAGEMARQPGDDDTIDADLVFWEDAQRRVHVKGRIIAVLALRCQRCLRVFSQTVVAQAAGIMACGEDSAADVPRDHEPIEVQDDWLDVHGLVSDEVLLALPVAARCSHSDCAGQYEQDDEVADNTTAKRTDNPFAILSQLKRDD